MHTLYLIIVFFPVPLLAMPIEQGGPPELFVWYIISTPWVGASAATVNARLVFYSSLSSSLLCLDQIQINYNMDCTRSVQFAERLSCLLAFCEGQGDL